jgi:two-component system nitrate/nitrite response regulator NarL
VREKSLERSLETIQLVVIDDHAMFREALSRAFKVESGFRLIGHCGSIEEGLSLLRRASGPTTVLMEINLGGRRVLEFVDEARRMGFAGPILVLTAGVSGAEAMQLVQAGVAGIIHKRRTLSELCEAIRKVVDGKAWLEEEYLTSLLRSVDRTRVDSRPKLSPRDRIVLQHVVDGLSNRDIGVHLNVSEGAVKASLRQLFDKMGVRTRGQLVKVALEQYKDHF